MWELDRLINRHRSDASIQTLRVIRFRDDGLAIGVIDIHDHCAEPAWITRKALHAELASGDATWCEVDPYAYLRDPQYDDPSHPQAHRYAQYCIKRNRNFSMIQSLIGDPRLFDRKYRGEMIEAQAHRCHVTEKHLRTLVRRFFQRGRMKNALLPDYPNSGPRKGIKGPHQGFLKTVLRTLSRTFTDRRGIVQTVTGLYALFAQYLESHHDKKGLSLSETLEALHAQVFNCGFIIQDGQKVPLLSPPDQRPRLEQLKYFYHRYWNKDVSRRTRLGDVGYGTKARPRNKGTGHMARGPGQLVQGDATPPEIIILGSIRRTDVVGPATLFFLIDQFSHLICGVSICVRSECYISIMLALDHMGANKVAYCRTMGITIEESEWPVANVPRRILVDNGVLRQWKGSHLVNSLGLRVMNTAAYRGDLKGLVERLHLLIKQRIRRIPGATGQEKAGKRGRPMRKAICTIEDLTKHVIAEVLCHNNSTITKYVRTKDMIRDGVAPIPSHLWIWGCKKALGTPRWLPQDSLRRNLLPVVSGTITDEGLVVEQELYTCPDHLCARARQEGRIKVFVHKESRVPEEVFLRDPDNDATMISCVLQDETKRGLHTADLVSLRTEDKRVRKALEAHDAQQRAICNARHEGVTATARKLHHKALRDQGRQRNDETHVQQARNEAIQLEDAVGAWSFAPSQTVSLESPHDSNLESGDLHPPGDRFTEALKAAKGV